MLVGFLSNIFTPYVLEVFICFFSHRNHQCGLQLVIWQVWHRSPLSPSLSYPLSPSLPSVPPSPPPLSFFSLIPLSSISKIHHAYQGVPHPHAHECGGVPHRPALYDPGEVTTPYSLPKSHPHTPGQQRQVMQRPGDEKSSQRGDILTLRIFQNGNCSVPNYEMIGHTVSDAGGGMEQRALVCW